MDRDIEKESRRSIDDTVDEDCNGTNFAPIQTSQSRNSTARQTIAPGRTVSRSRSHNGYGISEDVSDEEHQGDESLVDKDPFEVGWDNGNADPLNPRCFAHWRKWLIVIIVSNASLCVTAASSIYTPTYEQMEAEFGNSRIISVLGLSTFVLGISIGPLFLSPLSEFYGRRPIYIIAWLSYLIWFIPQAVAKNIATVIVCRFFNGASGSAFLAVSGSTVGDLFAKHQLSAPMLLFSLSPFMGPTMGPLIGGFINYDTNWRWTYYVLIIWSFVMWIFIIALVPETYHPIILRNKARKIRKETGDERWKAPIEKTTKSVISTLGQFLLRPFELLIFEPMCLNLCIFSAILLGILYIFFGVFPLVFRTVFGFNMWQIGLSFLGILIGMVLTTLLDPLWRIIRGNLMAKLEEETGEEGASEPEFRLPPAIAGSVLVPAGIFIFGWTSYPWVHWIVPIVGSALFGAGTLLLFTGIFTFLVDAYPSYAASALAANAFVRCAFAAAFPLFGNQMYEKLGYQWASSLLAFLTLAMMPFPYIFFKYGKRIRSKSRFATI